MNMIDRLIHPDRYTEREIQESIEHFWPCMFSQYQLFPREGILSMPSKWLPDIFAVETTSAHGSLLIVELKGVPPAGTLESTVNQVIEYGQQYHARHPQESIRLAIIGPWREARLTPIIDRDEYSVAVFSLHVIAEMLLEFADDLLLHSVTSPIARQPLVDVEGCVLRTDAVTALVMEKLTAAGKEPIMVPTTAEEEGA